MSPAPDTTEMIKARGEAITKAAHSLIGLVRMAERGEHARSTCAELDLEVELTEGGTETWKITIERTASSH